MMRRLPLAALALVFSFSPLAAQSPSTILILDASGSMWGTVDGQTKISAARKAVGTILAKWKPADRLGLMVYGHRSKSDCNDIEMMVPVGAVDAARINAAVKGLNPKGRTPLTDALRRAAAALGAEKNPATVILVSDGIETCKGDPCAAAAELKKANVKFTAHVIGFNVADPVTKTQLQCIARNTGGVYLDADNASGLESALGKAVDATQGAKVASEAPARPAAADPYKDKNWRAIARLAEGADPIADGFLVWVLNKPLPNGEKEYVQTETGARVMATAEPGNYIMNVEYGQTARDFPITIKKEAVTHDVILNAGFVTSEAAFEGSADQAENLTWAVHTAGGEYITTDYARVPRFILPAGDYVMVLSKGNSEAKKPFKLAPGDSINLAMTLDATPLLVDAVYAAGGPKVEKGIAVSVRKPPAREGEEGESIATIFDPVSKFDLPAGSYDVIVEVGAAKRVQRVEIRSGAPARLTVNMNAGVLALATPGAETIEVFAAKKDINGDRALFFTGFDPTTNLALIAGDYVVVTHVKDRAKETPVAIKPGERTELAIQP
jgi:Ca-activated chloride channel family protein